MSMQDPLVDALSHVLNSEKTSKNVCIIKPSSSVLKNIFKVLKDQGYVGEYELIDDGRGGTIKVSLIGKINKCGAVKPRFSFKPTQLEKYEKRFLPSLGFGILIVTTPKGIMTHNQAKDRGLGGQLLAFVY